jgi:hypothetical protein
MSHKWKIQDVWSNTETYPHTSRHRDDFTSIFTFSPSFSYSPSVNHSSFFSSSSPFSSFWLSAKLPPTVLRVSKQICHNRPHKHNRSLKVAVQGPDFWPTPSTYIHRPQHFGRTRGPERRHGVKGNWLSAIISKQQRTWLSPLMRFRLSRELTQCSSLVRCPLSK